MWRLFYIQKDQNADAQDNGEFVPEAFRKSSKLSQHISFLKDFFRAYKDFTDREIDTIEIMLGKLYEKWGITDHSSFDRMKPEDSYGLRRSEMLGLRWSE